ncbi:MAG TPA: 16S rRNA (guanine(966)-N(2))-methyltransferase RsmD [Candidatus Limnocylindria bacterium]|nr:16S rRNA (guanine(966)-N(2))-methyltransferase RsmD [Candidatus Limnocylindria bacterium]
MRVIAGKYRSRKLKGPGNLRLRPTSDRLRETLFNILGPSVVDSLFVDLYAGTGAIGIEAVSRGARETIFIESHAAGARLVRQNLEALGIRSGIDVIEADVVKGLKNLAARHLVADFIFLDPPYEGDEHLRVLEFLDESHLVAPYGLVIVEHQRGMELPERFDRLERSRMLEQGDAALSFYRLAAAA